MFRLILGLCLAVGFVVGCKDEKTVSLTGEEPVEVADFITFFPEVELPFTVGDTSLQKKINDSSLIAYSVFTQFVPDSILTKEFGKDKPKLYPLGRVEEKGKETYLFVLAALAKKRAIYLVTFDKKNSYLNTLPLIKSGQDYTTHYSTLDRKYQITTYHERKGAPGGTSFKRNVYIYNSAANDFTLILTEPNVEMIEEVINPIDTLAQKNKYTGDYVVGKKNFISFRDGRNPSEILFFVHFEKNKGECVGELKGTARFVSAKTARYNESGNPCMLEFSFTSSAVTMKEVEGCGTYRNIQCFFEGTYPKKKKKSSKNNK